MWKCLEASAGNGWGAGVSAAGLVYPDIRITHYLALTIRIAIVVQLINYFFHSYRCTVIMCVCVPAVHGTVQ